MNKKYLEYTAQQLINDAHFLSTAKDATGENGAEWDKLADDNEDFARELRVARLLLAGINKKREANQLSSKEEISLWHKIEQSTVHYKKRQNRRLWIRRSVAAAAVLAVCITLYHQFKPQPEKAIDYLSLISSNSSRENNESQEITLILSEQEKIALSGKEASVNYQQGYIAINANTDKEAKVEEVKDAFNQIIVPKGKRSFVTLGDGTQMWVNAGTTVVYPVSFTGNKREIFVEGEIFLAVTPDKAHPFIVKTMDLNIEVLGTQFNVSAYKEDELHHVILVEGQVEVKLPDNSKRIMQPNQQLTYKDRNAELHTVDNLHYLAWKNGYYQYSDQTIEEIIKSLTKYYGVNITCDEKAGKRVCTGKLDLKNDLHEVIVTLADAASLQVDFSESNINLFVKPKK